MDIIELMAISLAAGSAVVLDSTWFVSIIFCDASEHAITKHVTSRLYQTCNMI